MVSDRKTLDEVTTFYLASTDFNGIPVSQLIRKYKTNLDTLKRLLTSLIQQDKICIVFGDIHPNPHIKAFDEDTLDLQLEKLSNTDLLAQACVYPSRSHLKRIVDPTKYHGKPFTLRLAWGEPQLAFESFDLRILEFYRNDPHYYYETDDTQGMISVHDNYYESAHMIESDQVLLESFGFSYDSNFSRAVAVFLRYLSDLSPEHQQIWNARIVKGEYVLHSAYRMSTLGEWPEKVSIFDAFIEELHVINEMSQLMGRPPLFRNDLKDSKEIKPRGFGFLIRPTLKEFNDFVLLLDKIISDNINKKIFLDDIPHESEEVRKKDGKIIVREKGTLQLIEEWLNTKIRVVDKKPLEQTITTFKKVRKLRQQPALDEDTFDQAYFSQQRALIIDTYSGVRTLRLLFANHPRVKGYKVSDWLYKGEIYTF